MNPMEERHRKRLMQTSARLERSNLSENNKSLIKRFARDCIAEGVGPARVARYLIELRQIVAWMGKELNLVDKEDVKKLLAELEMTNYSEWSKHGFKVALKRFYKWMNGGEEYPEAVRWIRLGVKKSKLLLPDDLLTEEDVKRLIDAADHPRDRAFVAVLYETGARIGDLLYVQLKNLSFDQYGVLLTLRGKTGMRRVRVIASVSYLVEWLNKHPRKNDPEAWLWTTRDHRFCDITYGRIRSILRNLRVRAGISKKVNPHNFRHSRATYLAGHLTDAQMKEYLGWVQGSKMAAIYVHLSGRDVDNALLRLHGTPVKDTNSDMTFRPKSCARCSQKNGPTNVFCSMCGLALEDQVLAQAIRNDLSRKQADELLDKMLSDESFRQIFLKKARELVSQQRR